MADHFERVWTGTSGQEIARQTVDIQLVYGVNQTPDVSAVNLPGSVELQRHVVRDDTGGGDKT